MDAKDLYARMSAMTGQYAEPLRKYFPIVLGSLLYVSYLVLAFVFFRPSFFACIGRGGSAMVFVVAVANVAFFLLFGMYACRGAMPEGLRASLDAYILPGLYLSVAFLFMGYGMLFYMCKDPLACEDCDLEQETAFNNLVLEQVNGMKAIKELRSYYKEQMVNRRDIALCANYFDASYRSETSSSACVARPASRELACNISMDNRVGAPVLAEFFVMTSCRTCVVDHQYDSYVTDKMIEVALEGGARCLDFDVYPRTFSKAPTPIVTVARDRDNLNMQRSYVPLELCFRKIAYAYFSRGSGTLRDPLFVHLKLHYGVNRGCMDNIAKLLKRYFYESDRDYLMPPDFNHRVRNMGEVPICLLFNKLIVMVHTCDERRLKQSALDGMVNILTHNSPYAKEREWSEVNASTNRLIEYTDYNRHKLTFVRTSFHPYSPVANEISCRTTTVDRTGRFSNGNKSDAVMDLIAQKQTINNDPTLPMRHGCQFIAMNFQNLDDDMNKYIAYFKRASFIIKPKHLRRKDTPLTEPIVMPFEDGDQCSYGLTGTGNNEKCLQVCVNTLVGAENLRRQGLDPLGDDSSRVTLMEGRCGNDAGFTVEGPSSIRKSNGLTVNIKQYTKPR